MENKIEKYTMLILEYIVAIFIVLECRSVYLYSVDSEFYIMQILGVMTAIWFVANLLFKRIQIKDILSDYKFIIGITIYDCIFVIAHSMKISELVRYLYIFEFIFLMLYVYYKSNHNNIKSFLKKIVNVILVIAVISLFFYLFGTILKLIPCTNTFRMTWGDFGKQDYTINSYLNIHFDVQQINILGMPIYRNTSIFVEGPMYALNLVIALAIQMFILKEKNWAKLSILVITIITTISTAGILACIMCFVLYVLNSKKIRELIKNTIHKKQTILICTLIVVLITIVVAVLLKQKMSTSSYSTRVDDYISSILAWKDYIIFGNGIFNEQAIINYMSDARGVNTGISNSVATTLAGGGVYLSIIYIYSFCAMFKNYSKSKDISMLCFFIVMIYLCITTVFQYTIMMINIMAYAIAKYRISECEEKNKLKG